MISECLRIECFLIDVWRGCTVLRCSQGYDLRIEAVCARKNFHPLCCLDGVKLIVGIMSSLILFLFPVRQPHHIVLAQQGTCTLIFFFFNTTEHYCVDCLLPTLALNRCFVQFLHLAAFYV